MMVNNMVDNNDVTSCPECGSDDVGIVTQSSLFFPGREVFVLCGTCAASGQAYYTDYVDDTDAKVLAVMDWNGAGPRGRRPATARLFEAYTENDEPTAFLDGRGNDEEG